MRRFPSTRLKTTLFFLVSWTFLVTNLSGNCLAKGAPPSFAELVKKAEPGVVNIMAVKIIHTSPVEELPYGPDDPFKDFFERFLGDRMPHDYRQGGLGNGFIIDDDGYILTNNHVVESASELKVKTSDNNEYEAYIVGQDDKTDLALIRIKTKLPLTALPLGDSEELQVGDWVVAIGNPFGFGNTVTSGIVSAKYRQIGQGAYDNFIQTDASINPGNSGGPLLNMKGEVIGINSAIFSQSGSSVGIGFAIPINMAKDLLPQLHKGKVRRSYLGVVIQDVTPELKKTLALKTDFGALVSDIIAGTPASNAGIQRGDVITSFDGKHVKSSRDLPIIVAATPIGKEVRLSVMRKGEKLSVKTVTEELVERHPPQEGKNEGVRLGMHLQTITPELSQYYNLSRPKGLLILEVEDGSPAALASLMKGDIIVEADEQSVEEIVNFSRITAMHNTGDILLLLVDRGGSTLYVTMEIF